MSSCSIQANGLTFHSKKIPTKQNTTNDEPDITTFTW